MASQYLAGSESPGAWSQKDLDSLLALILNCVGTGGNAAECFTRPLFGTGGYLTDRIQHQTHATPLDDTADKIALIRSTLSLNVKELAAVLLVKRPTVYAWIAGTAQPQHQNRKRIDNVAALARDWTALCERPLGSLRKETASDGSSIMDMLKSDPIDTQGVRSLFKGAAAKMKQQKRAGKHMSLAERAKARGFTLAEPPDAQRNLDRLTGKRITPE